MAHHVSKKRMFLRFLPIGEKRELPVTKFESDVFTGRKNRKKEVIAASIRDVARNSSACPKTLTLPLPLGEGRGGGE
jgi:hypothetical protein